METYGKLVLVGLVPVFASIILCLFGKNEKIQKMPYMTKQIIIGIVFGGIAVLGTEKGILIHGATMNARDAAPLCAALIFGGPAGIISGLIGGVERWFAVYWGAGAYTRLACTISTFLSGLIGAILRKYMFDDETPHWIHAFFLGMVCEVLHMLMVFITNVSDAKQAFKVVETCSIPMVSIVTLSVTLAVLIANIINKKSNGYETDQKKIHISQLFQRNLLLLVVIAYLLTSSFTYSLQKKIAESEARELLTINIVDAQNDILSASDANLLDVTRRVAKKLETYFTLTNDTLHEVAELFDVDEINIVDKGNMVVYSTESEHLGFDMLSGAQSLEFTVLNRDADEFVQALQKTSYDHATYKKYAGKCLKAGGYVQVGYNADHFQSDLALEIPSVANNRHVGETGDLTIADNSYHIVSSDRGQQGMSLLNIIENAYFEDKEEMVMYQANVNGVDCYAMYSMAEGYIILATLPLEEANLSRDLAIYLNTFLEILVFAGLFILTYFLVKRLVVDNINKVDEKLLTITDGNLETVVDVETSKEFVSLSEGINKTVDTLKDYIAQANARIDAELKYAAEIQRSALPGVFPPFPERDEFEIYASMTPAKEVGGDFYDFYLIENNTLVFLIADVSGKGIPASLFMMRAKTLLKTYAEGGIMVNDIFTNANYNLCEGNDAGMFVTSWMGFLNLVTGELKFANAGHNPPVVKKKDGTYEFLRGKPGFILGGMEGIAYKEQSIQLEPGDEIYLYTDGVTEATNINEELFGEDRLQASLNRHSSLPCKELCEQVKKDVDEFVGEAPQFDDITMVSLKFKKLFNYIK